MTIGRWLNDPGELLRARPSEPLLARATGALALAGGGLVLFSLLLPNPPGSDDEMNRDWDDIEARPDQFVDLGNDRLALGTYSDSQVASRGLARSVKVSRLDVGEESLLTGSIDRAAYVQ